MPEMSDPDRQNIFSIELELPEPQPPVERGMLSELEADGRYLGADDLVYSPTTSPLDIPALLPESGEPIDTVVYVNGILTNLDLHYRDMQALANTGAAVVGLHNSTRDLGKDLTGCVCDKMLWRTSKPSQTLQFLIRDALQSERELHLVGHSRGALLISRALQEFQREVVALGTLTKEELAEHLSLLKIETYGSGGTEFIDGPQYVHMENKFDPVSRYFGTGKIAQLLSIDANLGRDAVLRSIAEFNTDVELAKLFEGFPWKNTPGPVDELVHSPLIYFKHRLPFDQVRAEQSKQE